MKKIALLAGLVLLLGSFAASKNTHEFAAGDPVPTVKLNGQTYSFDDPIPVCNPGGCRPPGVPVLVAGGM
jgi:hypothetical protein